MKKNKIDFKKITWYSQLLAVVLFFGTFTLGFYLGGLYKEAKIKSITESGIPGIISAKFYCEDGQIISTTFFKDGAKIIMGNGENLNLLRTISGSGARYANQDESFVFWNKGDTAFIERNGKQILKSCIEKK